MNFKEFAKEKLNEDNGKGDDKSWKKFHGKLWEGTKIYIVDGNYVRNNIDIGQKDSQFIEGGHSLVYDWMPQKPPEIWVERVINIEDMRDNLIHELIEYIQMKYLNLKYEESHDHALNFERLIRTLK